MVEEEVFSGLVSSSCFSPLGSSVFTARWIRTSRPSTPPTRSTAAWTETWSRTKSETRGRCQSLLSASLVHVHMVAPPLTSVCLFWSLFWLQPHHGASGGSDRQTRERDDAPGASAALLQDARLRWQQPSGRPGAGHSHHTRTQRGWCLHLHCSPG